MRFKFQNLFRLILNKLYFNCQIYLFFFKNTVIKLNNLSSFSKNINIIFNEINPFIFDLGIWFILKNDQLSISFKENSFTVDFISSQLIVPESHITYLFMYHCLYRGNDTSI